MPTKTKEQLAADIIADHAKPTAPKATAAQKEQARKARAGARIAKANSEAKGTRALSPLARLKRPLIRESSRLLRHPNLQELAV